MQLNKRGVALLQVLIISAILAGLSTMILRATLSRTVMSRQIRKTVSAQLLIESCMTQVNVWWASKAPETYADDLANCVICSGDDKSSCSDEDGKQWTCSIPNANGGNYSVRADMSEVYGRCQIEYTVENSASSL